MVRIGDSGRTELGAERFDIDATYNGKPAAGMAIRQAAGANALETADAIRAKLAPLAAPLILLGMALLATLGVTCTTLSMPYLMKIAVDTMIAQGNLRGLTLIALLYLALNGLYWLASYWQGYLSTWVGQHVLHASPYERKSQRQPGWQSWREQWS